MIECRLYRDGVWEQAALGPGTVSDLLPGESARAWIDAEDPSGRFGYPMALGPMALSGLVLFRVLKRREWLWCAAH